MARARSKPAGVWALLTADAITGLQRRSGMSTEEMVQGAGLSSPYYLKRAAGVLPYTLNDIEAIATVLQVTPLEIATLAAQLGEEPAALSSSGRLSGGSRG